MNCRAVFLEYYKTISEFSQIDIKFLLGEFDSAQEPEKNMVGTSFHKDPVPKIDFYCSSDMLCMHENTVIQAARASLSRFHDVLPAFSIGQLILTTDPGLGLQALLTALAESDISYLESVQKIVGVLAQTVFLVLFKSQRVDACGVHHKGPSHAAMLDSFAQMLIDGGVVLAELDQDMWQALHHALQAPIQS
tara:strand:- start:36130 stop:36705 length:576 start_codon:yes stop_codon:yes gene_type:complete